MLRKNLERALQTRKEDGSTPFDHLVFTFELVPARASKGKALDEIIAFSKEAAKSKRICALSITDNAGGHPALTPTALGKEIKSLGIEPVIHFSCKDKNRNLIESQLFELDRAGLNTLLVLTGDYPRYGYMGQAKPVFDMDSVLVLGMIQDIKEGLVINSKAPGGGVKLKPMRFHAGCVVSPFKKTEAEAIQQYLKLKRKLKAGADFIITQMGFDIRKYHELRMLLDLLAIETPLIATVFMPDARLARIINRGIIPGCTMPDKLMEEISRQSAGPDGGLPSMIERAAKQVAMLAGIGYQGVHLSGPGLEYRHIRQVLELARKLKPHWQEFVREFLFPEEWQYWLFEQDDKTGLNRLGPPGAQPHLNIKRQGAKGPAGPLSPGLLVGRLIHALFFRPGAPFFNMASRLLACVKKGTMSKWITGTEYFFKGLLYDCYRCGDCYLGDMEFICPQSQCAKRLVNGPCGGSRDGWCEVWPGEKRCLYVKQYERMKGIREMVLGDTRILPPRDWGLDRSSSWINFFSGKDHHHLDIQGRQAKGR